MFPVLLSRMRIAPSVPVEVPEKIVLFRSHCLCWVTTGVALVKADAVARIVIDQVILDSRALQPVGVDAILTIVVDQIVLIRALVTSPVPPGRFTSPLTWIPIYAIIKNGISINHCTSGGVQTYKSRDHSAFACPRYWRSCSPAISTCISIVG